MLRNIMVKNNNMKALFLLIIVAFNALEIHSMLLSTWKSHYGTWYEEYSKGLTRGNMLREWYKAKNKTYRQEACRTFIAENIVFPHGVPLADYLNDFKQCELEAHHIQQQRKKIAYYKNIIFILIMRKSISLLHYKSKRINE